MTKKSKFPWESDSAMGLPADWDKSQWNTADNNNDVVATHSLASDLYYEGIQFAQPNAFNANAVSAAPGSDSSFGRLSATPDSAIAVHPLTSASSASKALSSSPQSQMQDNPVAFPSATGFSINLKYDAAALAAPQSFRDGMQTAANILSAALTDHITVNLIIHYSGTGGGAAAGPDVGHFYSYSTVRSLLINNATPGDHTFDALPSGSSIQGQSQVAVWAAEEKLYGLNGIGANDTTTDDGQATFATDIDPNLLVGVALHELTHAMGRIPYGPEPDIFDFFRFTSPGTRLFQNGNSAPAAYFSLDGGNTHLADYGLYSDPSDFLNPAGESGLPPPYSNLTPNDPFNEYYVSSTLQQLTAVDLKQLDALGFHIGSSSPGSVSISDMSVMEGNSGTKLLTFTVTRTGGTGAFAVNFATSDGGATVADGDYVANSGTLNFGTNVNTQTISVTINGDTKFESDEAFFVNLSGATNGATISDNLGIGTIVNDDQTTANFWISEGPAPGINGQESVLPNNQINGAIQAIAVHPIDPNIMYVGSVNGGIWKTTNATAATPHWVPLTDNLPSLSIGALEFDPTDATHQTLIAGIGSTSSYFLNDQFTGVVRSTDGGVTWSQLGTSAADLGGENITSVAARGTTLLAAADNGWGGGLGKGLFRSTDSGGHWTLISDGAANHLPNLTDVSDIVGDPLNANVLYTAVTGAAGGVFKSTDTGLTWTSITSGITGISGTTDKIELAVHHLGANTAVYATVDNGGVLSGVFRSLNGGSFVALNVPSGGGQGNVHNAIAADLNNPNIVYVGFGGGSANYLSRIDASQPSGSQITKISGGTFGSPHVDTREMQIDANGNLILSTDGGLFSLPTPTLNTGAWKAIVGDMSAFEIHSIAYDHVSHVVMAGTQDNGTLFQQTQGSTTWDHPGFGDGGDVVIDDVSLAGSGQSVRYFSSQNLGGWTRQVYDSANHLVSSSNLSIAPPPEPPEGDDDDEDLDSPIADPTFTTPVELNNVNPARLLVGGSAHIYQSLTSGTNLTSIGNFGVNGIGSAGGGVMVYGGFQNGVGNADLIYAASGANVMRQTASGGGFTTTSPGGSSIRGVTDNPTNWATVFAIDDNQVFESTNAGATWIDVTRNLTSISAADFRSIEYVHGTLDDALVVGTSSGVFYAKLSGLGGAAAWSKFGANMPDVIVYDLDYDAADNVLVAGTMGRGAWLVNNATTRLGLDPNTAPTITSDGGGNTAQISVQENLTAVTTVMASDPDAGTILAYSIVGGADAGKFQINSSTGVLSFISASDFEHPTDADHNNSYIVQVRASDGSLFDDQVITVNVVDHVARNDFNGDDGSDMLWRHDNGTVTEWNMNGSQMATNTLVAAIGNDWHIVGTGNFSSDGKSDILWRHDGGNVTEWDMDGGRMLANHLVAVIGNDWHIAGTADFNGDGKSDILWRHDSGNVTVWTMNGSQIATNTLVAAIGNDWHIAGTGDFNGDGKSDILWRHDSGVVTEWDMDGGRMLANHLVATIGNDWHIAGTADFDGDRKADILWRHDSGNVTVWTMNGAQIATNTLVAAIGNDWHIAGTGDFSNDSKSDILWRHDSGNVTEWDMNGGQMTASHLIAAIGNDWHIV